MGFGGNAAPVHGNIFGKARIPTYDHDYQHIRDISSIIRSDSNTDFFEEVDDSYKSISKNKDIITMKKDLIVLFYLSHENPKLRKTFEEFFRSNNLDRIPNELLTDIQFQDATFESIGYISLIDSLDENFTKKVKELKFNVSNKANITIDPQYKTKQTAFSLALATTEALKGFMKDFKERYKDLDLKILGKVS